jgi:carbon monoxide dehydrogenase subunit G
MSKVERRNWLHITSAWAGNLRAIAEGEEPWPPAGLPSDVRKACAAPPQPGKTVQAGGAALINADAETVWEMVWAPETSRLIDPDTVAWAGTVPGTPLRAVGEMQCTVERRPDDRFDARVYTVSELTWGRRAVTQAAGPPWVEIDHLVMPADGGTRLELTFRSSAGALRKAAAARVADAMARNMQATADGYKAVIEKAAGTPSS